MAPSVEQRSGKDILLGSKMAFIEILPMESLAAYKTREPLLVVLLVSS